MRWVLVLHITDCKPVINILGVRMSERIHRHCHLLEKCRLGVDKNLACTKL